MTILSQKEKPRTLPHDDFTSGISFTFASGQCGFAADKKGYEIGLISQERYDWVCKKEELIKKEIERVNEVKLRANARVQHVLEQYGSIPLHTGTTLSDLIRRTGA